MSQDDAERRALRSLHKESQYQLELLRQLLSDPTHQVEGEIEISDGTVARRALALQSRCLRRLTSGHATNPMAVRRLRELVKAAEELRLASRHAVKVSHHARRLRYRRPQSHYNFSHLLGEVINIAGTSQDYADSSTLSDSHMQSVRAILGFSPTAAGDPACLEALIIADHLERIGRLLIEYRAAARAENDLDRKLQPLPGSVAPPDDQGKLADKWQCL
ncbi:MAG: hypothetical protein RJA70_3217 [Pseudomonadota bacterium]|jgi:hypothetical protein